MKFKIILLCVTFVAVISCTHGQGMFDDYDEPEMVFNDTTTTTTTTTTTPKPPSIVNHQELEAHPHGKPEAIIHFTPSKPIIIDREAIEPLLKLNDTIGDYKMAVYSIVGAFRQGKSFFMDYVLRYLYAHYKSINFMENTCSNPQDWMGEADEPLKGFSWRAGKTSTTAGIVIWSDIFLYESEKGEKIAIMIMDTQGLFDTTARMQDSTKIFALNSLFSSHLIFNMKTQIDEQQLQYLQLVSEYAKLIKNTGEEENKDYGHPFQNLLFLIRDWPNEEDHPYGLRGGTDYVMSTLDSEGRVDELIETRDHIKSSYKNIKGFLLPHPGRKVDGARAFDGRWADMDPEFKTNLKDLIEWLFGKENLRKKIIMGNALSALDYYSYLDAYCKVFQNDDFPALADIYETTIDKHMEIHVDNAIEVYKKGMQQYETDFSVSANEIDYETKIVSEHEKYKLEAINSFKKVKKMGTPQIEEQFVKKLSDKIQIFFEEWRKKILEIGGKFAEQKKEAEEKLAKMIEEAENERKKIENEFSNKMGYLNQTLENTKAEHEKQMENWNKTQQEYQEKNNRLESHIAETVQNFTNTIDENKKRYEMEMVKLETARKKEKEDRDAADRAREAAFNSKIDQMKAENLENSAAYNRTIEDHKKQLEEEKKLRQEQDNLHKQEREELNKNQKNMEEKLTKQHEDEKNRHKADMDVLKERFGEEKQERERQQKLREENDAKLQQQLREAQDNHRKELTEAMKNKENNMESVKEMLRLQAEVSKAQSETMIANLKLEMAQKSASLLNSRPNNFMMIAATLLITFIYIKKLL